jgi:hypothetical protein
METNISGTRVEKLWDALGFYSSFGVNSDRFSGGIGLFWKNDVVFDLKNFGSKHIDVVVSMTDGSRDFMVNQAERTVIRAGH